MFKKIILIVVSPLFCILFFASSIFAEESKLPIYKPAKLTAVNLSSIGSDSMDALVKVWVDEYRALQPIVNVSLVSRGSATAPAALIDGSADLGPMARPMKTTEQEAFLSRYGFEPTQVKTAYASVSVYVHANNPLSEVSFEQLEAIFAEKTSSTTAPMNATVRDFLWAELGIKGTIASKRIMALARDKNSLATSHFKQQVLLQKDFNQEVMETASLSSLFEAITANTHAIGFGETSDKLPDNVKALRIKRNSESPAISATRENIYRGEYPLSRELNVYIVRFPGEEVEAGLKDFLAFVLSEQGQKIVANQGLIPLNASLIREERTKLN